MLLNTPTQVGYYKKPPGYQTNSCTNHQRLGKRGFLPSIILFATLAFNGLCVSLTMTKRQQHYGRPSQKSLDSCELSTIIWASSVNNCCFSESPHEDIMTWNCFPHYWPFVRGIHSDNADQTLLLVYKCFWINNSVAGGLKCHNIQFEVL